MSKRASTNSNPLVVFLRGANAIGSRVFSPVALASKLSRLEVQNIGVAGTFIVRAQMPRAKVCAAFEKACPHDADVIVHPLADIERLLDGGRSIEGDGRVFVAVLASRPPAASRLPLERGSPWMVRSESHSGAFVVGRKRSIGGQWLDANAIVEREFGVRATTRVWETMERIVKGRSWPSSARSSQPISTRRRTRSAASPEANRRRSITCRVLHRQRLDGICSQEGGPRSSSATRGTTTPSTTTTASTCTASLRAARSATLIAVNRKRHNRTARLIARARRREC